MTAQQHKGKSLVLILLVCAVLIVAASFLVNHFEGERLIRRGGELPATPRLSIEPRFAFPYVFENIEDASEWDSMKSHRYNEVRIFLREADADAVTLETDIEFPVFGPVAAVGLYGGFPSSSLRTRPRGLFLLSEFETRFSLTTHTSRFEFSRTESDAGTEGSVYIDLDSSGTLFTHSR